MIRTTSFPINFQEESLYKLSGGKFFFRIDLSQAYYSIPIDEPEHRDKTAFYTLGQQLRFKVLPSQFNHLMAKVLGDIDDNLFFYFDDIIGSYKTADEMLRGLADVLQRLWQANLRVNFQKSDFALTNLDEIKWLGSIIHNNRIRPDQHKIDAIMKMQIPKKQDGMHPFIGVASYHRRHIKDFATIAAPLTKLLRNDIEYHIGEEEKSAFEELKAQLTSAPALALPNLDKPMIATTDASDIAVGGCLSQPSDDDDKYENVVAYCSHVLTPAEQNGSLCAKELNAILYAIGYFYLYLANRHFTLRTDSRGLIYLQSFKKQMRNCTQLVQSWMSCLLICNISQQRNGT